ncbi:scavenger receptor cysteine-rich domain-containing protein DMBT1-like [Mytilus edulis]|uniref:scavenger receptor cysteine-rich domain-containing protein DMBT1-like n=1 Tax=Mytilus edulis TaxID=6550 RepID=UPI0039F0ABCD
MKVVYVFFIVCAAAVRVNQVKNTRQCKAGDGICKPTCAVDEEDTGSCCLHSYRCCQPPKCNDTLQNAQCKARNGESKPACGVNEQDTGIGPFCNNNRCCESTACIDDTDCNCKPVCHSETETEDEEGICCESMKCCKTCNATCGGIFGGTVGSFTSPYYPSKYCNNHNCNYNIIVEEGSKVKLNFTYFNTEKNQDYVTVYDGEVTTDALLAYLTGGLTEGKEFDSTSNKMIIHFVSDFSLRKTGFSASYKTFQ